MRHEHERAGELEQALLEHLERRDVEVVRRLVEEQQVGGLEHQPREHGARLLAAGEPADRRLELLGAEEEALRPARDVDAAPLEDDRVAVRGERALERDRGVEARAVLVEDHDLAGPGACSTVPASGASWPASRRSSVLLPLPFAPSRPRRVPGESTRSRPRTIARSP